MIMSNILVVAAHPDDEVLGLGAAIRRHINSGDVVDCVILGEGMTSRAKTREESDKNALNDLHYQTLKAAEIIGFRNIFFSGLPDNRFDSIDLLDIVKEVDKHIQSLKPEIIYTHHYGDLNIDHRKTFEAVITASRPIAPYSVKEIYCFETPSSTEWNFKYGDNAFKPNVFIDVEDTLSAKLKAMECYKSEIRDYPHPRSIKALEIMAARWGTVVGKKYAEAFELIRKVM
jgi:LmbE family N-acetylglucosaminyl deacetylase